ncbi:MAG: amidase family protein, partial [Candidatus Pacebacteria bacterium]|nr:amidase family protein [Candidatus Paceibacterota bacterium]
EKVEDPISLYLSDIFTVLANIIGAPAIALPSGVDKDNLPTSIQYMSNVGEDEKLFNRDL